MTEPDRIRREIEGTQRNLSTDVNALTEKVSPGRVVERRVGRMKTALSGAKDRVMGTASEQASTIGDKAGSVASSAADKAHAAGEAVTGAPQSIRHGTRGNPLAAGLIAFGAGWLVSSLLPASEPERRLAGQVTDVAKDQLAPVAQQVAEDLKDNLREPAQHAVESVRSEAADSASTVTDEARSATGEVTDRAQENLRG
ncbi:DUF3618 domain-containing protein [Amycolatopsis sp., V23-08]|uniref:DUF3618 domain-containing protein n=1 Tax=Amycolatopsis heterodermiae TaxID=3110235 RepID=A0ABU5RLI5_9PSEU|nr:DUF3618 domain-containing protein [Amycolatopsis sp., V23-08]MEA5367137.1 DUF3618 domain-containing protein [Amycolatopsis sp., V23-08]